MTLALTSALTSAPLMALATYLSGEFENRQQAAAEPAWYVHLRLWQRPVPSLCDSKTYTFFLEQASVAAGTPPYRQRILQITSDSNQLDSSQMDLSQMDLSETNQLRGQYFGLVDPLQFQGAGVRPTLLNSLSAKALVSLPNSGAKIVYQPGLLPNSYQFQSALQDGQYCSFDYDNQRRYVYLGFEIGPQTGDRIELNIYDKGVDPDTGRGLWGALMGPFKMVKQASFSI
ncbi:MAG: chorismate mutase [Phormidesmis priestleyi]|uniref:Chromophore lyase CpcT/CpeT n=1 Tax=Phormidesmis priestleyi TaxID=268141 RepID=A0A2W4YSK2_9CYAN|nr:MAG: chorismate mutase [Phormidesmis priestleyi]